jgi:hypothetical protein
MTFSVIDLLCHTKIRKERGAPENFYIFEAL